MEEILSLRADSGIKVSTVQILSDCKILIV